MKYKANRHHYPFFKPDNTGTRVFLCSGVLIGKTIVRQLAKTQTSKIVLVSRNQ